MLSSGQTTTTIINYKEGALSTTAHISSLQQKRDSLKHAIHHEMKSPHYNELRVHDLKKHNLRLKDEIATLLRQVRQQVA